MGAGASAEKDSTIGPDAFTIEMYRTLATEFERLGRGQGDEEAQCEIMREMRTIMHTLARGEELADDRTWREKLSLEEYEDKKSQVIAAVLRWQGKKYLCHF